MSFIPCLAWVKRGAAKAVPDQVKMSKDELKKLILEARKDLNQMDGVEDEDAEEDKGDENMCEEEGLDEYDLEHYDDDEDGQEGAAGGSTASNLAGLTMFASNEDDPYITLKDSDDSDEEEMLITDTDNMLVVGQAHKEYSDIEAYIYNQEEGSFYVHHDILLSSYPLAMAWLSFDPTSDRAANIVAVGGMAPVIELWDVDVVDTVEPVVTLGTCKVAKKKAAAKKPKGHTDAVLSLSWNASAPNLLASASADFTALIWDMEQGKVVTTLTDHKEKVQAVAWRPSDANTLVTGSFDKTVRLYDTRCPASSHKTLELNGEIEEVAWNSFNANYYMASTDTGHVFMVDMRADSTAYTLSAHNDAVTGLAFSSTIPGFLVTASADRTMKVWDVSETQAQYVAEKKLKIGSIHCLSANPDCGAVFALGGEKQEARVVDLFDVAAVKNHFAARNQSETQYDAIKIEPADMGVNMQSLTIGHENKSSASVKKKKKKMQYDAIKIEPADMGVDMQSLTGGQENKSSASVKKKKKKMKTKVRR